MASKTPPIKINKSASALVGAGVLWTVYTVFGNDQALIGSQLDESVTTTAKIIFFLIGAMTIVEVIDAHNGFEHAALLSVDVTRAEPAQILRHRAGAARK